MKDSKERSILLTFNRDFLMNTIYKLYQESSLTPFVPSSQFLLEQMIRHALTRDNLHAYVSDFTRSEGGRREN